MLYRVYAQERLGNKMDQGMKLAVVKMGTRYALAKALV
jgi:hypothetical protein